MSRSKNATDVAARLLKQTQALALRAHGHNYRAIGKTLECNASTAMRLVQSAMAEEREHISTAKADYVEMELHRLDTYLQAIAKKVQGGDPRCVETALRIGERRAKLLGLDAPAKLEASGPGGSALFGEDQIVAMAEIIQAKRGGKP